MTQLLQCHSLAKRFGGVHALKGVDFETQSGEVHALVGENGAGKSTLIKILTGVYQPDEGAISFQGKETAWQNPVQARRAGIAVVHQEADLFLDLSAAENVLFSSDFPRGPGGLVAWKRAYDNFRQIAQGFGEPIPPKTPARLLTHAQRQMTEIMAAVSQDARLVFMDEPTTSLSMRECETLFSRIALLKSQGCCIVYVSHRLEEIFEIADRVTVLRDGSHVFTRPVADVTRDELITAMVGRETVFPVWNPSSTGEVALDVQNLSDEAGKVRSVSFHVRAGEVVGLYGLVGAGRSELAQALFGTRKISQGEITLQNQPHRPNAPEDAIASGLVYVPEDRLVEGLFQNQSIQTNVTSALLRKLTRNGAVNKNAEKEHALHYKEKLNVKCSSIDAAVSTLSGGNQQKVLLGRWFGVAPNVLILDEPTKGVDVGAKAEIHKLVRNLANEGKAVVMISSELPEVLANSDRILVMREGELAAEFTHNEATQESVLQAALPVQTAEENPQVPKPQPSTSKVQRLFDLYQANRESGVLGFLVVVWALLFIFAPAFRSADTLSGIFINASTVMIGAVGMTMIIAAGGIDISAGSLLAISAVMGGTLLEAGWHPVFGFAAALLCGTLCGMINAGVTYYGRIHSILTTLGTMSIFQSLVIPFTGGRWISNLPESFTWLGRDTLLGVPIPLWVVLAVVILFEIILRKTVLGRSIFALGSNPKAAKLVGISERNIRFFTFAAGGFLIALAGFLQVARHGQVQTNIGSGYELEVIAAAVLGGCSIMGGTGSAIGAALGALLLATVRTALVLMKVSTFYEKIVIGGLILAAVLVDHALEARKKMKTG